MKKIWLKGLPFFVTGEQFEILHGDLNSIKYPGTAMKEDEAFELCLSWYPEDAEVLEERLAIARAEQELRLMKARALDRIFTSRAEILGRARPVAKVKKAPVAPGSGELTEAEIKKAVETAAKKKAAAKKK